MEYNTFYSSEIVCPYCGYTHNNSYELIEDEGILECENCGREFEYERNIEITYNTYPL
jgi:transposase